MLKKTQHLPNRVAFLGFDEHHALPDPGKVAEIENVVKFGRCGKHLDLGPLPQCSGGRYKLVHQLNHFAAETTLRTKIPIADDSCKNQLP